MCTQEPLLTLISTTDVLTFSPIANMPAGYLQNNLWIKDVPSAYTPSQIIQYLSATGYSSIPTEDDINSKRFPRSLETLEAVMLTMALGVPFENTAIH